MDMCTYNPRLEDCGNSIFEPTNINNPAGTSAVEELYLKFGFWCGAQRLETGSSQARPIGEKLGVETNLWSKHQPHVSP